jgi:hypothetical protein
MGQANPLGLPTERLARPPSTQIRRNLAPVWREYVAMFGSGSFETRRRRESA